MCGRYRRRSDKQRIAEAFEAGVGLDELYLEAEDDIAPGSVQPVVLQREDGTRQIEMMRWGFKLPDRFLFNARSEGVDTSRFWKESFRQRRCLVPADSFYEWQKVKSGKKPKYEFEIVGQQPFGMAGIWAPWKNPKTLEWEHTFAILTGEANAVMRPIHDREPVIIASRDYAEYLAPQPRPPAHLLRILPNEELKAIPAS
ncbi:MAG: SOS response-associated peptidase [Acidobacteriaceae bacterium]